MVYFVALSAIYNECMKRIKYLFINLINDVMEKIYLDDYTSDSSTVKLPLEKYSHDVPSMLVSRLISLSLVVLSVV